MRSDEVVKAVGKSAWIFPGQGSQHVGMGKDVYERFAVAKEVFNRADEVLGFGLTDVCFSGPEEKLRETRYTQLAVLTSSVALWRLLKDRLPLPEFVAGHSVGEYSALVANGCLDLDDALRLVKARAEAMHRCGLERPGAMAALMGMPEENLKGLLAEAEKAGIVVAANFNSPAQIVVSGEEAAVGKAVAVARDFGAKKATKLNVSGAFHSPLMKAAEEGLVSALEATAIRPALMPLVSNVTAEAATEPSQIADLLGRQITSPVLWTQSVKYIVNRGVDSFVEVGPGNVLCGLVKRIAPRVRCVSCSGVESLKALLGEVAV